MIGGAPGARTADVSSVTRHEAPCGMFQYGWNDDVPERPSGVITTSLRRWSPVPHVTEAKPLTGSYAETSESPIWMV